MVGKRMLLHTTFLLLLPLVVVILGLSVASAIGLVLFMLLWRWMISLSAFVFPERVPKLVLETISASHFVEKVRWNMDRTGLDYVEKTSGGTLGAYFAGRTVPRLRVRTGATRAQIGNSPEILRFLWGAYSGVADVDVSHLEPTPERLALEKRIDRYGVHLQLWIYYHVLADRNLTLRLWGVHCADVPMWQRGLLRIVFPLQAFLIRKSFRITPENYARAQHSIDELLSEIEATLSDGRASILGGETINFTDIAFAAMTGLWLQPREYADGKADDVRAPRDTLPEDMQTDIARWSEDHPRTAAWVKQMYANER